MTNEISERWLKEVSLRLFNYTSARQRNNVYWSFNPFGSE